MRIVPCKNNIEAAKLLELLPHKLLTVLENLVGSSGTVAALSEKGLIMFEIVMHRIQCCFDF